MMTIRRPLPVLLPLVLLAACQSSLDARVTRFSAGTPPAPGRTFSILPDTRQAGNLEFQHYAEMVAARLRGLGFRPLPHEGEPAELEVTLAYADAGRHMQYFNDPGPYWAGWGGVGGSGWWGWSGAYAPNLNGYTVYAKTLEVDIFDGPAWRAGERRMLWQGDVFGESQFPDLASVMPAMTEAAFQNFPGPSGQTVQVSVPINPD